MMARYSVTVLGGITGETLANLSHYELDDATTTLRRWFPNIVLEVTIEPTTEGEDA